MRVVAAIVALCAIGAFAGWVALRDNDHWRDGDPRHASRGVFRSAVIALALICIVIGACICSAVSAHARPSPFPPVTQYNGDKIVGTAQLGAEVARAVKAKRSAHRRAPVARKTWRRVPVPQIRPVAYEAYRAEAPRSFGQGMVRVVNRVLGRPARWCGWWLGQHLGMHSRDLWRARNWAKVGSPASPGPGVIVVWSHHVGIITGRSAKGWIVKSGNDGHAVRERARSIAGAIAFRRAS